MRVNVSTKRVEWAHCDVAGIVFYPHFYTWFDQATERLFRANNLSYGELKRDFGIAGMPLLETGATYQNPCKLGDNLEIRTCIEAWANRTFLRQARGRSRDQQMAAPPCRRISGFDHERRRPSALWGRAATSPGTGLAWRCGGSRMARSSFYAIGRRSSGRDRRRFDRSRPPPWEGEGFWARLRVCRDIKT